jgi:hypothetical protein
MVEKNLWEVLHVGINCVTILLNLFYYQLDKVLIELIVISLNNNIVEIVLCKLSFSPLGEGVDVQSSWSELNFSSYIYFPGFFYFILKKWVATHIFDMFGLYVLIPFTTEASRTNKYLRHICDKHVTRVC